MVKNHTMFRSHSFFKIFATKRKIRGLIYILWWRPQQLKILNLIGAINSYTTFNNIKLRF